MPSTNKMSMVLNGSSAPRFVQSAVRQPNQLASGTGLGVGVSLNLNRNMGRGMTMGMLNRIKNARPGCSSCGGGPH